MLTDERPVRASRSQHQLEKEGKHHDDEGAAEDPPGDGGKEPAADRGAHRAAEEDGVMAGRGLLLPAFSLVRIVLL